MRRGTIRRTAMVFAAGCLLLSFDPIAASAAPAADETVAQDASEVGKPLTLVRAKKPRHAKVSRARKPAKVAMRVSKRRDVHAAETSSMPETVANAKAQMPAVDAKGAATAIDISPPPLEAAAAEQMTELGKSLTATTPEPAMQMAQLAEDPPPAGTVAQATVPAPQLQQARASAANDAWAQSSLIGKIFIAFGGMLTLASAARMLVA